MGFGELRSEPALRCKLRGAMSCGDDHCRDTVKCIWTINAALQDEADVGGDGRRNKVCVTCDV